MWRLQPQNPEQRMCVPGITSGAIPINDAVWSIYGEDVRLGYQVRQRQRQSAATAAEARSASGSDKPPCCSGRTHLKHVFLEVGTPSEHPAKEEQHGNGQCLRKGDVVVGGHQAPNSNGVEEGVEHQAAPNELEAKPSNRVRPLASGSHRGETSSGSHRGEN